MNNVKTYLFSYNYQGSDYSLEIPACSIDEAKERLSRMVYANYDGELVAKIPALPSTGIIIRLVTFIRNSVMK